MLDIGNNVGNHQRRVKKFCDWHIIWKFKNEGISVYEEEGVMIRGGLVTYDLLYDLDYG
jgi:hypothetical protein